VDNRITLEFSNEHPAVCAVEIAGVEVPTIFLLGDSTVCDQSREPFCSWGQMLTRFFKPEVAIANHGESGETYRDSIGRRRLDKILSVMKPGDYLIMQFGHNDQKQVAAGTGGPFTTYKAEIRQHVDAVRRQGGIPVVVSPMERRGFDGNGRIKPSLADYAEASRQAARELQVAFIDLNAMSIPFYEALGRKSPSWPLPGRVPTRWTTPTMTITAPTNSPNASSKESRIPGWTFQSTSWTTSKLSIQLIPTRSKASMCRPVR